MKADHRFFFLPLSLSFALTLSSCLKVDHILPVITSADPKAVGGSLYSWPPQAKLASDFTFPCSGILSSANVTKDFLRDICAFFFLTGCVAPAPVKQLSTLDRGGKLSVKHSLRADSTQITVGHHFLHCGVLSNYPSPCEVSSYLLNVCFVLSYGAFLGHIGPSMINLSEALICLKNAYVLIISRLWRTGITRLILEDALKFHSQQNFHVGFPVAVHKGLSWQKVAKTSYFIPLQG